MRGWIRSWMFSVALLAAPRAHAIQSFTAGDLSSLTFPGVQSLLKTVAIGTDHRAYRSATPLGPVIGLDMGLDVTTVQVPTEFIDALATATQKSTTEIPSVIPVPRLSVHKGLPYGLDLGFSYISYQSLFKIYGGDLQWAFIRGRPALPSMALRVSHSQTTLWFIKSKSTQADLIVSKNLHFIDPYLGVGMQFWSGTLDVNLSGATGLSVSNQASGSNGHLFVGLPIKLVFIKVTGEVDVSTAGITTYGGKFSLSF